MPKPRRPICCAISPESDENLRYCYLEKWHAGPHLARLQRNRLHRWPRSTLDKWIIRVGNDFTFTNEETT
jgi:hypothetical protein